MSSMSSGALEPLTCDLKHRVVKAMPSRHMVGEAANTIAQANKLRRSCNGSKLPGHQSNLVTVLTLGGTMEVLIFLAILYAVLKLKIAQRLNILYRKSVAATRVEMLLQQQKDAFGLFEGDPASTATEYVQTLWDEQAYLVNGGSGQRPHRITIVICSLALAVGRLDRMQDSNLPAVALAFLNALSEADPNAVYSPLSRIDYTMINDAMYSVLPILQREGLKADENLIL